MTGAESRSLAGILIYFSICVYSPFIEAKGWCDISAHTYIYNKALSVDRASETTDDTTSLHFSTGCFSI